MADADILIPAGSSGVTERYVVSHNAWEQKLYPIDVSVGANDLVLQEGPLDPATGQSIFVRWQDVGDGTYAEVVSLNGA